MLSGETVVLQQRFHDKEQMSIPAAATNRSTFYVYENNVFIESVSSSGARIYGRIEVIGEALSVAISTVAISYIDTRYKYNQFFNLISSSTS